MLSSVLNLNKSTGKAAKISVVLQPTQVYALHSNALCSVIVYTSPHVT